MTLAVVVNGGAGVGKDAFVDYCMEYLAHLGYSCSKHSSVDQVKAAAHLLGWDGVKDEAGRQFLSDVKDLSTRAYDGPMRYMLGLIEVMRQDVMFFHVREPREIAKFLAAVPRSVAVLVERPGVAQFGNHADANVWKFDYPHVVANDSTLDVLRLRAGRFIEGLGL